MNDKTLKVDVLMERSTSYWLRDAIAAAERRDPVDALGDAEVLVRILKERADYCMCGKGPYSLGHAAHCNR